MGGVFLATGNPRTHRVILTYCTGMKETVTAGSGLIIIRSDVVSLCVSISYVMLREERGRWAGGKGGCGARRARVYRSTADLAMFHTAVQEIG